MKKSVSCLAGFLLLAACTPAVPQDDAVSVAATLYPLAEVAARVGGNAVTVSQLVPPGAEAHDFEPSPRDIAAMEQADLLLLNGGIDAWAEDVAAGRSARGDAVMTFLGQIDPLTAEEDHVEEHEEDHDHGRIDPHAWLDPLRLRALALAVGVQLAHLDPARAEQYRANADAFASELSALDADMFSGLKDCERREIIVAHDAYGYLADRYGLTVHAIAGLSPEDEPSPRRMAELAAIAKEKGINVVFFESLADPKLAQTVAAEANVETAVLHPLESLTARDVAAGKYYDSVMRENLAALRSALSCR